ncbi:class I SAM-dependent DNA methyltransferase [Traorella massiliensis]|uniref:class I SAM-dependent DNA methyltransferase n=2 Tax=Traorella massiliensis TaxID=1903263 RepID=UPI0008F93CDE|nr:class I SAM-dependent methyltransferase [Traorella massiliensis]
MYQVLARFYDALVKDDKATQDWVDFIEAHASFQRVLEYACGSGEITLALARKGYDVKASDLSSDMIEMAKRKEDAHLVDFKVHDMVEPLNEKVDCVLCLCDSMNYLIEEDDFKQVLHNAYMNLNEQGTFIFDVHSLDRLKEFEDEFYEEGVIDGCGYEWSIETHGDCIYQNFVFFDQEAHPSYEQHIQRVYDPSLIREWCQKMGFKVSLYTDFKKQGIHEGEKYFFVCERKSL